VRAFQKLIIQTSCQTYVVILCSAHRASMTVHEILEFYNVGKENHEEEDPRNIKYLKIRGNT